MQVAIIKSGKIENVIEAESVELAQSFGFAEAHDVTGKVWQIGAPWAGVEALADVA